MENTNEPNPDAIPPVETTPTTTTPTEGTSGAATPSPVEPAVPASTDRTTVPAQSSGRWRWWLLGSIIIAGIAFVIIF